MLAKGSSISRISGSVDERARERRPLLHAARELVRIGVGEARRGRRARGSARTRSRRSRGRHAGELEPEADVVGDASPTGSAGTTGRRSRSAARAAAARRRRSTVPASGATSPSIRRSSVVLPQPLGPTRLTKLSRPMSRRHVLERLRPAPRGRRGGRPSRRRGGDDGRPATRAAAPAAAGRGEAGTSLRARARPLRRATPSLSSTAPRTERSTHSSRSTRRRSAKSGVA